MRPAGAGEHDRAESAAVGDSAEVSATSASTTAFRLTKLRYMMRRIFARPIIRNIHPSQG